MGKQALKHWMFLGTILAVTWGASAPPGAASEGYLRAVGPAPLRYRPAPPAAPATALPPLRAEQEHPADATNSAASPANWSFVRKPEAEALPAALFLPATLWLNRSLAGNGSGLPLETNPKWDTSSPMATTAAGDLLTLTPEMLVQFFKPAGSVLNQTNAAVLVPLRFTPPSPPALGLSSATYRSP
jgi:hypothetical protein